MRDDRSLNEKNRSLKGFVDCLSYEQIAEGLVNLRTGKMGILWSTVRKDVECMAMFSDACHEIAPQQKCRRVPSCSSDSRGLPRIGLRQFGNRDDRM